MRKAYKILGFLILIIIALTIKVNAATATLSVNKTSVNVGDTVTATVTYTAAAWDLKVTADSNLTTSSTTHYADTSETAENVTKSFTVSYTAKEAGSVNIKLSGNVTDESATTSTPIDTSKTVTINAKETTTAKEETPKKEETPTETKKSNNANLKTLGVTPKEYDFTGFKKDKTEYSVTIPNNIDKLNVLCKTEDKNAKTAITGNSGFEVGSNNKIEIKVTAEDGTTKTYTIKVTKLAEDEEKPGNVIDDANELFLTKLEIEGIELSPEFVKDTYFYKATLSEDIEEVTINAEANNPKAKVTISGNTGLVEGKNTISIIVTLDGKVEQKVYQVILTKELETETISSEETTSNSTTSDGIERYMIVGAIIIVFIILVIVILIVLIRRESRKQIIDDDDDEIEEVPPLKSKLFNQDEDTEDYRKTIEEINAQTRSIFHKDEEVKGQSVEYEDDDYDNYEKREKRRKGKGKH